MNWLATPDLLVLDDRFKSRKERFEPGARGQDATEDARFKSRKERFEPTSSGLASGSRSPVSNPGRNGLNANAVRDRNPIAEYVSNPGRNGLNVRAGERVRVRDLGFKSRKERFERLAVRPLGYTLEEVSNPGRNGLNVEAGALRLPCHRAFQIPEGTV